MEGLEMAINERPSKIIVSSDPREAVQMIMDRRGLNGEYGAIMHDILHMREQAKDVEFMHEPRELNSCADVLAKWALHQYEGFASSLHTSPPQNMKHTYEKEMADAIVFNFIMESSDDNDE